MLKARTVLAFGLGLSVAAFAVASVQARQGASRDIVDTAVAAGSFKTLAQALTAADLVDTLKGTGPFTVFAPTDEAFAKLPAGTLKDLLKPENKAKLRRILTYHVVPGAVSSADVVKLTSAKAEMPISTSANARSASGRRSRTDKRPPSSLPSPSPAMNDATISDTDTTPMPVWSVRMRCQTTW